MLAVRRRVNDLSYRLYDRMRHREAFSAAAAAAGATDFEGLRGQKYAVLVTYRRDGSAVPTPVWLGVDDAGRCYVQTERRTAKVRRVRRDPRASVFPSDPRGRPLGPATEASVRLIEARTPEGEHAERTIQANYGRSRRLYERLLGSGGGVDMVYLELTPRAAAPAT